MPCLRCRNGAETICYTRHLFLRIRCSKHPLWAWLEKEIYLKSAPLAEKKKLFRFKPLPYTSSVAFLTKTNGVLFQACAYTANRALHRKQGASHHHRPRQRCISCTDSPILIYSDLQSGDIHSLSVAPGISSHVWRQRRGCLNKRGCLSIG